MTWKGFKDIQARIEVDVTKSEEELLAQADRSRRKNAKKAIREGLMAVEGKTDEEWDEWHKIYKKVCREGGIEHDSLEKYKIPGRLLMLIKKGGKILGGGVFGETENKFIWKAYASLIEFQHLRVNDFLYWSGFVWAKKRGKKIVDLGGWQIKARGHLEGINNFKKQWGGKIVYYNIYSKNLFYILGRKAIRNFVLARWFWDRIKKRPQIKQNENKENKKTYETENSVEYFYENFQIFDIEKKIIEKYFKGKILDLGCGCGRTTKYLFEKGYDVKGVEIVEDMVKKANNIFPKLNIRQGDACKLNFKGNSFDVVFFSYNGLDYIFPEKERVRALKEISRVLKKGGYFVYSSHNPKELFYKFRPNFILRNFFRGTLFSKYKLEKQKFGNLSTYYGSPKKQKKLIEGNTDLKLIKKISRNKNDLHPHYIFVKK